MKDDDEKNGLMNRREAIQRTAMVLAMLSQLLLWQEY